MMLLVNDDGDIDDHHADGDEDGPDDVDDHNADEDEDCKVGRWTLR